VSATCSSRPRESPLHHLHRRDRCHRRARGKNAIMSNDKGKAPSTSCCRNGWFRRTAVSSSWRRPTADVLDTACCVRVVSTADLYRQTRPQRREAIFKVHLKPIKISSNLDINKLAEQTPGFAGPISPMSVTKRRSSLP